MVAHTQPQVPTTERAPPASSVLLIADPGAPAVIAEGLAKKLPNILADRGEWHVSVRVQPYLPDEQAPFADVIESVAPADEDADIVVYLTDLPRRDGTMPVIADVSVKDRFGLISVAGVGGAFVLRRVAALVALVIAEVLPDPELIPPHAKRFPRTETENGVRYFAPKGLRRLRLLTGMVRANRPWRLALGLSRVLVGAFATGAVGLATNTIWQFADTMGPWRLSAATILSSVSLIAWLVIDHELWERPRSPAERDRARLYNTATLITLFIGVAVLHIALFILLLGTTSLTLTPDLLARTLGHPVGTSDYLRLAWLLASIATLGGALGSGLEDDEAVRAAAYGVRQRQRFEKDK
ncbi:MAG: hypothetical protein JWR37_1804 [Mycobacterium sp.]|nr:hypothetical protein [Mycobacterium sp.]